LNSERAKLSADISEYENSDAELTVVIEASSQAPAEHLRARVDGLRHEISELTETIEELSTAVIGARTVFNNAKDLVKASVAELNDRQRTLAERREEINRLQNDPRTARISLEIDDEELASEEKRNVDSLAALKSEAATAQTEVAQKKTEIGTLLQESTSIKSRLQTLQTQYATLQRRVTQITARLQESKVSVDATEEVLLSLIAAESRQQAQLAALRDSISSLELAVDAETTAAALTALQQNIRNKENALRAATEKRDQHQPWLTYFSQVSRLEVLK